MAAESSSSAAAKGAISSRSDAGLVRADFEAVYRDGARRAAAHFVVLARPTGLSRTRLGISVRRAVGGAVVRNRIKRRIRALWQRTRGRLPAGWDVVVEPRTGEVARASFRALETELTRLLEAVAQP